MKKIVFSVLFLFFLVCVQAQTVDEIIDKHLAAMGGKEKLRSIKSMRMSLKGEAQGFSFPVEMVSKKNGGIKSTTTIQNMKMVQCYDEAAKTGWTVNPMMGDKKPQKMNEEEVKQVKDQGGKMESDLLDYKEKGHSAEYLGKDDMDGDEVYLVKLIKKTGDISYYYIDVLSNFILKEKTKTKMKDKEIEGETYYSNYQTADGITYPATIETGGAMMGNFQINVEKVEYNIEIDDNIFKMPGAGNLIEQNKEK